MKSKANQIYLKEAKIIHNVMSIHYQKFNYKNIIHVTTILRGLSVFSPFKWKLESISQTIVPLATFLVLWESPPQIWVHQVGFTMF
jgi:hypothetical protein